MYYYSQAIHQFQKKLLRIARDILTLEMNLKCTPTRFEYKKHRYPLSFITFEREKLLGFFDSKYLQIGIHRHFLFLNDDKLLRNVIRHELVHYLTHIQFGAIVGAHGSEFKNLCHSFGYGSDISSATYEDFEGELMSSPHDSKSPVIEKIKKLLRLSESSNPHEAELALQKANTLLREHHLNPISEVPNDEVIYHIKVLTESARVSAKDQAISEILSHFFVKPIFNHGRGIFRLEVFGLPHHIEMAEYLYEYLNQEIDSLWEATKKQYKLKGLKAKNSFIWGLCEGFMAKLKVQETTTSEIKQEILLFNHQVTTAFHQFYRSKQTAKLSGPGDSSSRNLGRDAGSKLSINKPIKGSKQIKGIGYES